MSWKYLILCQNSINCATQSCSTDFRSKISIDVIHEEVGGDTFSYFPSLDVFSNRDYLASHIRAGDKIVRTSDELQCSDKEHNTEYALCKISSISDHEITILFKVNDIRYK